MTYLEQLKADTIARRARMGLDKPVFVVRQPPPTPVLIEPTARPGNCSLCGGPLAPDTKISVDTILNAVAEAHMVSVVGMLGPRRKDDLVHARAHAVYLMKTIRPDLSYPQMGKYLEKDHTTILHSYKVIWPKIAHIWAGKIKQK